MKLKHLIGTTYATNYEALNAVIGMRYGKRNHPQSGLFHPGSAPANVVAWFLEYYEDDRGWLNEKHSDGEIWETNSDPNMLSANATYQGSNYERVAFSRQSPNSEWVFEGVYRAGGVVNKAGKVWRRYLRI